MTVDVDDDDAAAERWAEKMAIDALWVCRLFV